MNAPTLSLIFMLLWAIPAMACSCATPERVMTASVEAEGRAGAVVLAIRQDVSDNGITTTYAVLDRLNGPLEGTFEVYDPDALTSCSSGLTVGMMTPIVISTTSQSHKSHACSDVPDDLIIHYQMSGEDLTRWPYSQCVEVENRDTRKRIVNSARECDAYRDGDDWYEDRRKLLEPAKQVALETFNHDPDLHFDNARTDLSSLTSVDQMESAYFVFAGNAVMSELRPDGSIWIEYRVTDDFGQFLGDTVTLRSVDPELGFGASSFVVVERDTNEQASFADRGKRDVPAAFADWALNGNRWPLPLETCYGKCQPGEFDRFAFEQQFWQRHK